MMKGWFRLAMTDEQLMAIRDEFCSSITQMIEALADDAEDELKEYEVWGEVASKARTLFRIVSKKMPRYPFALSMDCCYIALQMSGLRRGKKTIQNYMDQGFGRRSVILPKSRRSGLRWIEEEWARKEILDLFPIEESYDEMVAEG